MIKGLMGKKLGMTQVFAADGKRIPVTVVQVDSCVVLQKKTVETDGYNALQLGTGEKKMQRVNKPMAGHFKAAAKGAFYHVKEFRADDLGDVQVGDEIRCQDVFSIGDIIDVSGVSKGKGFAGVIKRWGFAGGRSTHGSTFHRGPGSIGCSAWPSRVFRGKKMPGQMGNANATTQNLQIVDFRADENLLLIKGAVPGAKNGVLVIKKAVKAKA